MTGVGAYLAERRTAFGLSLETLAADTRIVPRLLRALEAERLDELPPAVYVRGFIRACCDRLGEAPDEALRLYEAQRGAAGLSGAAPLPAAEAVLRVPPEEEPGRSGLPRRFRRLVVAGAALAVIAGVTQRMGLFEEAHQPPARAGVSDVRGGTVEGPRSRRPGPAIAAPAGAGSGGFERAAARVLVLRAEEATWVRVVPESGLASEALLTPGAVREWRSRGRFVVTVGNAGGVHLELDGAPLPALGARGAVVRDVVLPPRPDPDPEPTP